MCLFGRGGYQVHCCAARAAELVVTREGKIMPRSKGDDGAVVDLASNLGHVID